MLTPNILIHLSAPFPNVPIISTDNIFACQFHPEKSSENGLNILKNFCEI